MARIYGQQSNSSSMVTFVVENAAEPYEEAYQQAYAEAKSRATRLAKLAGTTIGPMISIDETASADSSEQEQVFAMSGTGSKSKGAIRLTSDKLGDIPVRVTLQVRFAHGPRKDQASNDERKQSQEIEP
jgi:uncharacterized protein YggE